MLKRLAFAAFATMGCGSTGVRPTPDERAFRPYSDDSPWNTPIAADTPIRPDSRALIAHLGASSRWANRLSINLGGWSVPVYETSRAVPRVAVHTVRVNAGDHVFDWPVPAGAVPASQSDGHMVLVDRAAGLEYDFYQGRRRDDGTWDCTLCVEVELGGSGVRPPYGGGTEEWVSHGSRACGFPLLAGLIRLDEIERGQIDHALILAYPGVRQGTFVSPASTSHAQNGFLHPDRGIPCGGRVQLDPSLDLDALGLPPAGRTIAEALQRYGAYVGDFSGSINVYAEASASARAAWQGVLDMKDTTIGIPVERLRVIEWGELRVGQNLMPPPERPSRLP